MAQQVQKKGQWQEFKEFLNQGDFVTIAVGLIFALYVKAIVDALILGIIKPIIAAIFGKPDFTQIGFDIGDARISIGLVIGAIIDFIVIGVILFLLIKGWNRLRRMPGEPEAETELSVLREIRNELKTGAGPTPSAVPGPLPSPGPAPAPGPGPWPGPTP
jgi:large conductance mechanosensitive channel